MGSLNKKASGAQCFIMALGLFWDIVTGLPWTPNGVGSLEPWGYCIFLPGAHYLTINSPYGADSSLNKLLLLLLLQPVIHLFHIHHTQHITPWSPSLWPACMVLTQLAGSEPFQIGGHPPIWNQPDTVKTNAIIPLLTWRKLLHSGTLSLYSHITVLS